jgi:hypothetical protein
VNASLSLVREPAKARSPWLVSRFSKDKSVPSTSLDGLVTGETRYYDLFKDAVEEVTNARVRAGYHFRHAERGWIEVGVEGRPLGAQELLPTARLSVKRR